MDKFRTNLYDSCQELQALDPTLTFDAIWEIAQQSLVFSWDKSSEEEQAKEDKDCPRSARIWTDLPTFGGWIQAYTYKATIGSICASLQNLYSTYTQKESIAAVSAILEADYPHSLSLKEKKARLKREPILTAMSSRIKSAKEYAGNALYLITTEENYWSRRLEQYPTAPRSERTAMRNVTQVLSMATTMIFESVQAYRQMTEALRSYSSINNELQHALAYQLIDFHIAARVHNELAVEQLAEPIHSDYPSEQDFTEANIRIATLWGETIQRLYDFHHADVEHPAVTPAVQRQTALQISHDKANYIRYTIEAKERDDRTIVNELEQDEGNPQGPPQVDRQTSFWTAIRAGSDREAELKAQNKSTRNYNRQGDKVKPTKPPPCVTVTTVPASRRGYVQSGVPQFVPRSDSVEIYNADFLYDVRFHTPRRVETAYIRFLNQAPELAKVARVRMGNTSLAIDLTNYTFETVKRITQKTWIKEIPSYKLCFVEEFRYGLIQPLLLVVPYQMRFESDKELITQFVDPSTEPWQCAEEIKGRVYTLRQRVLSRRNYNPNTERELMVEESAEFYQLDKIPNTDHEKTITALKADRQCLEEGSLLHVERLQNRIADGVTMTQTLELYNTITTAGMVATAKINQESELRDRQGLITLADRLPRKRWYSFLASGEDLMTYRGTKTSRSLITCKHFYTPSYQAQAESALSEVHDIGDDDNDLNFDLLEKPAPPSRDEPPDPDDGELGSDSQASSNDESQEADEDLQPLKGTLRPLPMEIEDHYTDPDILRYENLDYELEEEYINPANFPANLSIGEAEPRQRFQIDEIEVDPIEEEEIEDESLDVNQDSEDLIPVQEGYIGIPLDEYDSGYIREP
jgi:hypothetical protein